MWWWLWTRLVVTQVVSTSVQCFKALYFSKKTKKKQKKPWLHVCLTATSLLSYLLKTWLLSLIKILNILNVDRAFLWKLILVNKWCFVYRLNNIRLKATHCACASKQVCRCLYWRHALIGALGFAQFTIKEKRMPSLFKIQILCACAAIKEWRGLNYKQLTSVLPHFIILQPTWPLLYSQTVW